MKKLVLPTILFFVIVLATTAAFLGYENKPAERIITIPKVSEMNLHDAMKTMNFGLFYYQGNTVRSVLEDDLVIDPTKPMVITTHGMHSGAGYSLRYGFSEREYWQAKGYNCFVFRWSQFSDDSDPFSIERKEWSGRSSKAMKFYYEGENGERILEDVNIPNYSLAEIFAAYYNDFMTRYDIKSPEIRLMGHSMGGQLVMAISSYIKTVLDCGTLNPRYMFNRVTMLDPFLSSEPNDVQIDWLDRTTGTEGSAGLVIEVLKEYASIGIPVEYIRTGFAHILVKADHRRQLAENSIFIDVDSSYIPGNTFEVIAPKHQVAIDWTNDAVQYEYFDAAVSQNYAGSPSTPTIYVMAQFGAQYSMQKNFTEDAEDDVIYSTTLENGVIAGYAFFDENDNGLCDDSFLNRCEGIKVELYNGAQLVATSYTNRGGYYKFSVSESMVGKTLKIKVAGMTAATKAIGTGAMLLSGNGINANGESDVFSLSDIKEIKIINIGSK